MFGLSDYSYTQCDAGSINLTFELLYFIMPSKFLSKSVNSNDKMTK